MTTDTAYLSTDEETETQYFSLDHCLIGNPKDFHFAIKKFYRIPKRSIGMKTVAFAKNDPTTRSPSKAVKLRESASEIKP